MKRIPIFILLCLFLQLNSLGATDYLELGNDELNAHYRTASGCEDKVYNTTSASMIGWGVGLATVIAILAAIVHHSQGSNTTTSSTTNTTNVTK